MVVGCVSRWWRLLPLKPDHPPAGFFAEPGLTGSAPRSKPAQAGSEGSIHHTIVAIASSARKTIHLLQKIKLFQRFRWLFH
jgi:hypothetical protein